MNPDKLRNLLQSIDIRLARAEKDIIAVDGRVGPASNVVQELTVLRAEVRRQLSKVDALKRADVSLIEQRVGLLRKVATNRLHAYGKSTPISEPLRAIMDDSLGLTNLIAGIRIGLNQLGPEDVLESLPGQKPAAFQFGFEGDRFVVVDQPLRTRERDKDIAAAALDAATEKGAYVSEQLAQSNCSPRLRDAFRTLQDKLEARANIIQVGMYNQTCGRILRGDVDELSPTLFELLRSHVELVFAAAAQFEDWRVFRENAVEIDRDSITALSQSTQALIRDLKLRDEADPQVTKALDTVVSWTEDKEADKRDVLALTGTLQNLWSLAAKSALAKDVVSEGRKLVAKAIIGALLAATTAAALAAFGKVPGTEWIETTVSYFRSAGESADPPAKSR